MDDVEVWCRCTVVGPDGRALRRRQLGGPGVPDLGAIEDVARLALKAARLGGHLVLSDVSPELRALLELSGLGVEVERQAECREQPLRIEEVEEEAHPGDLPA
jgi:hypothetical protein